MNTRNSILLFTKEQAQELDELIEAARVSFETTSKERSESKLTKNPLESDDFLSQVAEETRRHRIWQDWVSVRKRAEMIIPEEQNKRIDIGNGVIISYADKSRLGVVLVGYVLPSMHDAETKINVSLDSPFGTAVCGAKEGDKRRVKDREITIERIFLPSEAERAFEVNV